MDTSVLVKARYGHASEKAATQSIPQPHYICRYVTKEFYQSVILTLVELYFESEDEFHPTFHDACTFAVNNTFGVRGVKILALGFCELLKQNAFSPDDPLDKQVCRAKLRDHIFQLIEEIERDYRDNGSSREKCARLSYIPRLKQGGSRDDNLLKFSTAFNDKVGSRSRCRIAAFLSDSKGAASLDCFEESAQKKGTPKTVKKLCDRLQERRKKPDATNCDSCAGIGDVIIAANSTVGTVIHSFDRSFQHLSPCYGRQFKIHESLQQMKKDSAASDSERD